jgi:hypothetical protein
MKQSILNSIVFCDRCNKAFIPELEGDNKTCDECLSEDELEEDAEDVLKLL